MLYVVTIPVFLSFPSYTMHNYWCTCRCPCLCLSSSIAIWWDDKFCLLLDVLIYHELQLVLWNARTCRWLVPRIWVHNMLIKETLMCVNVSNSCEGALSMSGLLEICLQKGSVFCISQSVSLQSSMRGGGAFTLSVVDASVGSVVLVGLCVLLQVWVAGPSGVVVTNMWIETVEVAGVFLTSTNHER